MSYTYNNNNNYTYFTRSNGFFANPSLDGNMFNDPFFTNNNYNDPLYNTTTSRFIAPRNNYSNSINTDINTVKVPRIAPSINSNLYYNTEVPNNNNRYYYMVYNPVHNNNTLINNPPGIATTNYINNNNLNFARVLPIDSKQRTYNTSVPKSNNRNINLNNSNSNSNPINTTVLPIFNNPVNGQTIIHLPKTTNPLNNNKKLINNNGINKKIVNKNNPIPQKNTNNNSNKKQALINKDNNINLNPNQNQTINNNNNNNNNIINTNLPKDNFQKKNIMQNMANMNKPNQNNVNNVPNQNNDITTQNQNTPKIATVTKLTDGHGSTPAPTPIKKRIITDDDYFKIIYKDIGIINLGNTCFINSCLQVLIHCNPFINKFFNKCRQPGLINQKDTPISLEFFLVCKSMVNTINTGDKYIDITNFKQNFGAKHPQFEGYLQNDSQEFCRILLEDISTELNEVKTKPVYRTLTNTNRKSKKVRDLEFHQNFSEREKSIITELFYAQIITTYTCECKLAIYSFQKILDFPLLLPDNVTNISINDLLKSYFQTETIDFQNQCEKCKKVLKHKKEIKISRPPEILILSLQRIDQVTRTKNECFVSFPQVLDMSEFIDNECGFNREPIYNLFAVINHAGNIDCGHYYSFIKLNGQNDWYEFNDSSVRNIGPKIDNFPYAYALFYIKNQNRL
jgi:ubiquitin C-terminal hydrolase